MHRQCKLVEITKKKNICYIKNILIKIINLRAIKFVFKGKKKLNKVNTK